MVSWQYLYNLIGIKDFIYFISSPVIQETLFPVKLVFIFFTLFFLFFVIYFYINSSYLQDHFLQDTVEFLSWQPYGLRQINKRWQKIAHRIESENPDEYKLAIVEADDFLYKLLEDNGYQGETFEELLNSASSKIMPSAEEIISAHRIRNSVVYDTSYRLDLETTRKVLGNYERAIKNL